MAFSAQLLRSCKRSAESAIAAETPCTRYVLSCSVTSRTIQPARAFTPGGAMKNSLLFAAKAILSGFLIVIPIYLAVLLLLKGMKTVGTLMRPFASLLPDWLPADELLSLLLVLFICFLIGVAIRTAAGRSVRAL